METTKTIERFAGEYHFLSNFAHTPMCFRGHYFQNAEIQAVYCNNKLKKISGAFSWIGRMSSNPDRFHWST